MTSSVGVESGIKGAVQAYIKGRKVDARAAAETNQMSLFGSDDDAVLEPVEAAVRVYALTKSEARVDQNAQQLGCLDMPSEEVKGIAAAAPYVAAALDCTDEPEEIVLALRPCPNDYRPQPGALARSGSWLEKARANVEAIELAVSIEKEGRQATADEQAQLARFMGFGAAKIRNTLFPVPPAGAMAAEPHRQIWPSLVYDRGWRELAERLEALPADWQRSMLRSTQFAHFTGEALTRAMWHGMVRLGFKGGRVLDAGAGSGMFAMTMPRDVAERSSYVGVEMDGPTATIAKLLLPDQTIQHADWTQQAAPRDWFDAAIMNPPFSATQVKSDARFARMRLRLHDYFCAKVIDSVRPGGLMAVIVSRGTMDKVSDKARRYIAKRADLVGAFRMPSMAFADVDTHVVTDVLFFRRRADGEEAAGHAWVNLGTMQTADGEVAVSEFYVNHPESILGSPRIAGSDDAASGRKVAGNGQFDKSMTVIADEDMTVEALGEQLRAAIDAGLPESIYKGAKNWQQRRAQDGAVQRADRGREGVVYLSELGALMRVENGMGHRLDELVKLSVNDAAWMRDYVGLRDMVKKARQAQFDGEGWEKALNELNSTYERFVARHGNINAFRVQNRRVVDDEGAEQTVEVRIFVNRRLLAMDYESALVAQLEVIDEGEISKGPFLRGRTIGKPVTREVATISDALAVSLDEVGRLDLADVGSRIGLTTEAVIEALGKEIYCTPAGVWQMQDEYLSGNVVAKLAEARQAAMLDPAYQRNVDALLEVQPHKLGPSQISVGLGASWVPAEVITEFARFIGVQGDVTFDSGTETWQVAGASERSLRRAGAEYGTADRSSAELLEAICNSRTITVKKKVSDTKTETDAEATTTASEVMDKIRAAFKSWIWTDVERTAALVERYNELFNCFKGRTFNGDHLSMRTISLRFKLHAHQKRAIWRQIAEGNTYLNHAVGAGKTIELIAGAMEQKRLGLIKMPMLSVPNHTIQSFATEFMSLYPLATVLVADEDSFSPERRRSFIAAATMNGPDAIIITHGAMERIGVSEAAIAPIRDEMMAELVAQLADTGKGERVRRAQLEQQKESLEQQFASISGRTDTLIAFDELGVDAAYIDEAHLFRKLNYTTMQRIKGLSPSGSRRALDLYIKTRVLERRRPGRAFTFASGTPVTNSLAEIYTLQRFFSPDILEQSGCSTFDSWCRNFAEVVTELEANPTGKFETVSRLSRFVNTADLGLAIRSFMDVLTFEDLGDVVKRPNLKGGRPELVMVEQTPELRSYLKEELSPRLEKSRRWKPSKDDPVNKDPVIAITTDGRFAALDPRFFGASVDEEKTPTKIGAIGDYAAKVYRETADRVYLDSDGVPLPIRGSTQLIVYNLGFGSGAMTNRGFDARQALTRRLVARGVAKEHILWFDDANTTAKKEAMYRAMRSGRARIMIGSAKKMGVGVNVQDRLVSLCLLDPPWYPSDVEQPHGRILRQGNMNEDVSIAWFATKGTYDSAQWSAVARKSRFIAQLFRGDSSTRTIEDISETSQYQQAAAIASGDPRQIQLAGMRHAVERLIRLEDAHASEQIKMRGALQQGEWQLDSARRAVERLTAGAAIIGNRYIQFSSGTVSGVRYSAQGTFGEAIKAAVEREGQQLRRTESVTVANIEGMDIVLTAERVRASSQPTYTLTVSIGAHEVDLEEGLTGVGKLDAVGLVRRIINTGNATAGQLAQARRDLAELEAELGRVRRKVGAVFEAEGELAQARADLQELEIELKRESEAEEAREAKAAQEAAEALKKASESAAAEAASSEAAQ